jgi:outer membrane protein OmpA-like peptidoglycan-associated protein
MNTIQLVLSVLPVRNKLKKPTRLIALTTLVLMVSACGTKQLINPNATRVQSDFVALQADRNLATKSPLSMKEAEQAVKIALVPERDKSLSEHRVYIADRKVQTARSMAQAQYAVEQRAALSEESNDIRLDARTREADFAKREAQARTQEALTATSAATAAREQANSAIDEANVAKSEASASAVEAGVARTDADAARTQANAAKSEANDARLDAEMSQIDAEIANQQANTSQNEAQMAKNETSAALAAAANATSKNEALMLQLAGLQAKQTERGVQLTLGDVLFSTGQADLKAGSAAKLDQLVAALSNAPDRRIMIEGFTDSIGSNAMNQVLSQNRANTVSGYLISHGIPAANITASGKGEMLPVAGNENSAGRQLNRRVEVTIENPSTNN